jgi:hypothetical protein
VAAADSGDMSTDLDRAAEALDRGDHAAAELHAWNALLTAGPYEARELHRLAVALDSPVLRREVEQRWPGSATAPVPAVPAAPPRPGRVRRLVSLLLLVFFLTGVGSKVAAVRSETGVVAATADAVAPTPDPVATPIGGDGIWLVPLGRVETVDLGRLAYDLSTTYGAWAGPVEVVALPPWTRYPTEDQLSAEKLIDLLNLHYDAGARTTVVGITDYDMRSWDGPYSYSLRAQVHYGVVSTSRLGASLFDRLRGHDRYERVRKLVKRQVEFHRQGAAVSSDPHSLRRSPFTGLGALDALDEGL